MNASTQGDLDAFVNPPLLFDFSRFGGILGHRSAAASANCCTSDITLAEFNTLCGKMDASNPKAATVQEYLGGTPSFRTDLYSTCGEVLSRKESIELIRDLGGKFTPELKARSVAMPFQGTLTQKKYAQKMINEYKEA